MKIYNPLSLDTSKDEPTFVNEMGVKWWLVSVGSSMDDTKDSPKDGAIYRTEHPDRAEAYVVIHKGEPILETGSLESAFMRVDENYMRRTKL